MKILIVTATRFELDHLIPTVSSLSTQQVFYKHHELFFLSTGVGMVNTTFELTRLLTAEKFDLVLNLGICGSFNRSIALGETVHIASETFSDLGAQNDEDFLSLAELNLQDPDQFPWKQGWMTASLQLPQTPSLSTLRKVKAITVNTGHGNEAAIARTLLKFAPDVESMEGGAMMFVCMQMKQAFLQLRAVSNYVEKRDRSKWNIPLALENLKGVVHNLLEELP